MNDCCSDVSPVTILDLEWSSEQFACSRIVSAVPKTSSGLGCKSPLCIPSSVNFTTNIYLFPMHKFGCCIFLSACQMPYFSLFFLYMISIWLVLLPFPFRYIIRCFSIYTIHKLMCPRFKVLLYNSNHRGSTVGFLLLQCSSGVVRHPRDLQVSVATHFCRVLIFASS